MGVIIAQFFNTPPPTPHLTNFHSLATGHDYSSQHLKWIKKVQSCPKTRTHLVLGFKTTLMKGFDPHQMLTSVLKLLTFTFMHLADAFIQSDLHCIQVTVYQLLLSLGIEPMILALLAPCSTIWATGKPFTCRFLALNITAHQLLAITDQYYTSLWILQLHSLLCIPCIVHTVHTVIYVYCKCIHIVYTAMLQSLAPKDFTAGILVYTVCDN